MKAKLKEPFIKRAKKAEFTACNVSLLQGEYYVDFKGKKVGTSAILTNMLGDVALLVTSEDDSSKEVGDEVSFTFWLIVGMNLCVHPLKGKHIGVTPTMRG